MGWDDVAFGGMTGGLYNLAKSGYGLLKNTLSGPTVKPYDPDPSAFEYGGDLYGAKPPPDPQTDPNGYVQWMLNGGDQSADGKDWQRQQQLQAERARLTGKEDAANLQSLRTQGEAEDARGAQTGWNDAAWDAYTAQYGARGQQGDVYNRMLAAADRGPGPSAAQAQLRAGQDANMQQSLALARSGRGGMNTAALRQAQFANTQIGQQTNQQAAVLRAQEEAAWRNYQAGLYGAAGGLATNQRAQDLTAQQTSSATANAYGQQGLGYEGAALQYGNQAMTYEGMVQNQNQQQLDANIQEQNIKSGGVLGAGKANSEADAQRDAAALGLVGSVGAAAATKSDIRAKEDIRPTSFFGDTHRGPVSGPPAPPGWHPETLLDGSPNPSYHAQSVPPPAYSAPERSRVVSGPVPPPGWKPETDLYGVRNPDFRPAQGYTYEYKSEARGAGAPPGKQYGPMAQDLEQVPGVVKRDPASGYKTVDTSRLSLANTAAISEQQRRDDDMQRRLDALQSLVARIRG